MPNPIPQKILNGETMQDKGFCSTTFTASVAERFVTSESSEETCCLIRILATKPSKSTKLCCHVIPNIEDSILLAQIASAMGYKHVKNPYIAEITNCSLSNL